MNQKNIIEELKKHYTRDIRKQLVKTILESEKSKEPMVREQQYQVINKIFTYVLQESHWKMGEDSKNWDSSPLEIMNQVFPQLNTTQWYQDQNISTESNVDIKIGVEKK